MNFNYIFWEEISTEDFEPSEENLKKGSSIINISRDEDFRLSCVLKISHEGKDFINQLRQQRFNSFDIQTTHKTRMGKIEGFSFRGLSGDSKEVKIKGVASSVTINYQINKEAEQKTIIYWLFSNIKDSNIEYSRSVHYKTMGSAEFQIEGFVNDVINMPILEESHSRTAFVLEFQGHKICFGKVDEKHSGKNNKGMFLRFDNGYVPTDLDLKIIIDYLSFIFGGLIIPVGYVKFGKNYSIIEQSFWSPLGKDIKQIANSSVMPAIPLDFLYIKEIGSARIEEILSMLLKSYLEKKDTFILDKVISYIKCARLSVFDVMLQPLFTGLDLLQQIWFTSSKTKSEGKYLDDVSYNHILSKHILNIREELKSCPDCERIINKLKSANRYTLNDREERFFTEIGLKVGLVENEIMKERNKTLHGTLKPIDYERTIAITYGAYALINRIILRILDYAGDYVDYSTRNFPYRPVSEPLNGPENNGAI